MKKETIYPIDKWNIIEKSFDIRNNYRNETIFSLSNGYIGTRGTQDEDYSFDLEIGMEGNYVNGVYESADIRYGEANFGSPLKSQTLLNLPNMKTISMVIDGECFSLLSSHFENYERCLSLKTALLTKKLVWITKSGKRLDVLVKRIVSFENKHLLLQRLELKAVNFTGELDVNFILNAKVENNTRKTNPIVDYGPYGICLQPKQIIEEKKVILYEGETKGSHIKVGCGFGVNISPEKNLISSNTVIDEFSAQKKFGIKLQEDEVVIIDKHMVYTSSLEANHNDISNEVVCLVTETLANGGDYYFEYQKKYMEKFWENAAIEIVGIGADSVIQGLNFNLFHIFQGAGRDEKCGMPAKALTGEGYEGHYFWDTEMYMIPLLIYTQPEIAKALLSWRYNTLDEARNRARILGHSSGALFPWRTINGQEASTYYPLGTAQYHINADISYAVSLYYQATGDVEFMLSYGAEILLETARVWADVGDFADVKEGKYCICSVTGPDEYNVLVDNNFYTNIMARENLRDAVNIYQWMKEEHEDSLNKLVNKINFNEDEIKLFKQIIEKMYLPYDKKLGIFPLDDGFLMRKRWDENKIPEEKRAWLYENYHPLFIMRHKMSKQADSMLALFLYNNYFSEEEIKRNYDFYQKVTLHHSSLSTSIFGIIASDIGYDEEAYGYFITSARMDLDDHHNNVYAGIHGANMAGTWQALVNGFAGMRLQNGVLSFKPNLPKAWDKLSFQILFKSNLIKITLEKTQTKYELIKGKNVCFLLRRNRTLVELHKEGDCYLEKI